MQGFARVRQCLASTEVETKHAGCALQHGRGCSVVDIVVSVLFSWDCAVVTWHDMGLRDSMTWDCVTWHDIESCSNECPLEWFLLCFSLVKCYVYYWALLATCCS